jgi:hypothetical protein
MHGKEAARTNVKKECQPGAPETVRVRHDVAQKQHDAPHCCTFELTGFVLFLALWQNGPEVNCLFHKLCHETVTGNRWGKLLLSCHARKVAQ